MMQSRLKLLASPAIAGILIAASPLLASDRVHIDWSGSRDVEGKLLSAMNAEWKVVYFFAVECPLARLYGERLNRLAQQYAAHGVHVVGVNSNPQDSVEDINGYIEELHIGFPILKDQGQVWPRWLGATRTAEVFLLDAADGIRYQGRIDDQYEPGVSRGEPKTHELQDAIDAVLAGREPLVIATPPVGCLITIPKRPEEVSKDVEPVTFTRDVAPVLNRHCVECHRDKEIAPFALTDYEEVIGWGEMMLEVIDQGRMPPWHANPQFGKFIGERHMPTEDRETLTAWVAQGMPEGNPEDLPSLPHQVASWHLPIAPEQEFAMRERPFVVPAQGTVEYQYFVVDPGWQQERWVRAAQVVPGNAEVVHHSIVFVRPPDGSARGAGIGWLGSYVPGQRTTPLPHGHAFRIPPGSKFIFQMHYTPNGKETSDITKVGIWFSDPEEVSHEVGTRVALNHDFEIPPGDDNYSVAFSTRRFARESRLLSATPHMHVRGKSFRLEARRDDQRETLLHVPHYDFNWQHWYHFETPLQLSELTALEMQVCFDNSKDNPTNPDPEQYVTWGDQTWQEMAVCFFQIAFPRDKPRVWSRREVADAEDAATRLAAIKTEADRFMSSMDRDGDGVVSRDEVPDAFRLFGFRRMDQNRDNLLQYDEVEEAASRRL